MSSFLLPRRAADPRQNHGLRRYSRVVAGCTLLLIFAGGLVTSTGSGLAVPDWPLSYGQLMPRMVGGILYEHGHRMIAGAVALMMAALCFWTWRVEPRRWVRNLAFIAMGSVLAQALLGGLTVIFLLPPAISSAHAGLAEIFLCLTVTLATAFSHGWLNAPPRTTAGTAFPVRGSLLAGVMLAGVSLLILALGGFRQAATWVALILYAVTVHAALVLVEHRCVMRFLGHAACLRRSGLSGSKGPPARTCGQGEQAESSPCRARPAITLVE